MCVLAALLGLTHTRDIIRYDQLKIVAHSSHPWITASLSLATVKLYSLPYFALSVLCLDSSMHLRGGENSIYRHSVFLRG